MSLSITWHKFKVGSYKIWLGLFLIIAVLAIFALRANNEHMIKLRSDVYAADKAGSGIEPALDKLRSYVYGHMNTNLSSGGNAIKPPIQLKYTYDRLEAAAQAKANNLDLYSQAQAYCQAAYPRNLSFLSQSGGIQCVQSYIVSHGGKAPAAIPAALYEYDFVSPSWSPDLAGWLVLTSLFFFTVLAGGLLSRVI